MRIYVFLVFVLLVAVSAPFSCCQVPQKFQQDSLGGLIGVTVTVNPFEPSLDGTSLTQDLVQTDAELRLRKAGISVVDSKQFGKQFGNVAILFIGVNLMKLDPIDKTIYAINMSVVQPAKLLRISTNTPPKLYAMTWKDDVLGHVNNDKLSVIRQSIGDEVDKFANDFLAANPKQLGLKPVPANPAVALP